MISIILPVYNEEQRIGKTLEAIGEYLNKKNIDYELIIVDDGSTDNSVKVVEEFFLSRPQIKYKLLKNNKNLGKGAAIRKGVFSAEGKLVYFTDADLSTPIEEMFKFIDVIEKEGYDIVIGSRGLKESKILVHQPFYRETMGKIFNKIIKILLMKDFNDTQCGAKMFKNEVAKKVFSLSKIDNFAFDVEILYIAKKLGFKIKELPVVWKNSKGSKVKLFVDSLNMLLSLFKIRFNKYKWT
jgi:dolichyl-phosphate beta-glucosyltransferase